MVHAAILPPSSRRDKALGSPADPERVPVGVLKEEWEKRHRPFDTMECTPEKCPPGGGRTLELWKKDGPQDPMRNIRLLSAGGPEGTDIGGGGEGGTGAAPNGDQPEEPTGRQPEPADDPEAREREARVERLLRRRAERSGEDPAEAIREYLKGQKEESANPIHPADAGFDTGTVTGPQKGMPNKSGGNAETVQGMADPQRNTGAKAAKAQDRLGELGFDVVPDDHKGPLTGSQVTRGEHEQMLKEMEKDGQWGWTDAGRYALEKAAGVPPQNRTLAGHKDQWVRDHATLIKVTARRHGIPPEVLAGIVHTETGGMPDAGDDVMNVVRSALPDVARPYLPSSLGGDPNLISAGDVSIQLRHAARQEGRDPGSLTFKERADLIDKLQENKAYALDAAARYVKGVLDQAYPDRGDGPLDQRQVMTVGYGYNLGYPHHGIDPDNPSGDRIANSSYGPDLWKKLGRMRRLLE